MLLTVRRPAEGARLEAVTLALDALACVTTDGIVYEARVGREHHDALRSFILAFPPEGGRAWLLAAHPPWVDADEPYRRLWDRTEEHALAIGAWKAAQGPLPVLLPGDLIRLCD
jgi:hypothetical protein